MHLGRTRVEQHLHDLARRRAAHDRVVDDDEPLAGDLGERIELHADPLLAHALLGLDEGAVDVAVLDQPLAEGDPRRAREADRGGGARVGDRQRRGRPRRAPRRRGARPSRTRAPCTSTPSQARVGAGEIEELEDAEGAARRLGDHLHRCERPCSSTTSSSPGRTSRSKRRRPGRVRRSPRRRRGRRRAGRARAGGSRARRGRRTACPPRGRRSSPPPRPAASAPAIASPSGGRRCRDHRRDHLAVGGRARAAGASSSRSSSALTRLPLCAERDGADAAVVDERLGVRPGVRAGRRVAGVADRELAAQARELLLVEDLGHEAEVAQPGEPPVVGDGDAGRLLAAMLQRVEPEVGEPSDVALRVRGCRRRRTSRRSARAPRSPRQPSGPSSAGSSVTITPGPSGQSKRRSRLRSRRPPARSARAAPPGGDVVGEGEAARVLPDERDRARRPRRGRTARRGRPGASATGTVA